MAFFNLGNRAEISHMNAEAKLVPKTGPAARPLFTSCSATFSELPVFRATFCIPAFCAFSLVFFSNSDISEEPLELKLVFLTNIYNAKWTIYEFPVKKEPNPPSWGR